MPGFVTLNAEMFYCTREKYSVLGMNEDIEIKFPPKDHNLQNIALGNNLEIFMPWEDVLGAW